MNLHELIERYIAYRQTLGERFKTNASILRAFGRAIGAAAHASLTSGRSRSRPSWLGAGRSPAPGTSGIPRLLGFYRYAISRGHVAASPAAQRPAATAPAFCPLHLLAGRTSSPRARDGLLPARPSRVEPITLRAIVLLLYGAGLRVHEAVSLNREDVDLAECPADGPPHQVLQDPTGPFQPVLGSHSGWVLPARPAQPIRACQDAPFFTTTRRARACSRTPSRTASGASVSEAGIRRNDGARYQPRLHDLRHTFAVHRLTSWYRQGADVQKLLPQLSVYLGHAYLAATQVYLSMTPELLAEASARFERYAGKEGRHD